MLLIGELNTGQLKAAYLADIWWNHSTVQLFEISGAAGTGKTYLVRYLIERFGLDIKRVLFVAYTGKAATVLAANGLPAQTIHSAFYDYVKRPLRDENGKLVYDDKMRPVIKGRFEKKKRLDKDVDLIVIDEAPMVNETFAKDIFSFHKPVIALGDLNQLPPVFGDSVFLLEPDVVLTEIMRQAEGSPIIYLSQRILHDEPLIPGIYKTSFVMDRRDITEFQLQAADMILTGTNRLRHTINNKFRNEYLRFNYTDFPQIGEKVMCKKNNWDRQLGHSGIYLTNGMTGTIEYTTRESLKADKFTMDFKPDFGKKSFRNLNVCFSRLMRPEETAEEFDYGKRFVDQFEFGYATTVHASQGSQWPSVLFFDQKFMSPEDQKKLEYTAVTRAKEQIGICI